MTNAEKAWAERKVALFIERMLTVLAKNFAQAALAHAAKSQQRRRT